MGGEKTLYSGMQRVVLGSPPRGRGKVVLRQVAGASARITPAWAGKRFWNRPWVWATSDHPRVGGEKMHLSLTLAHDTLHALTQFFNRVAFVDKLQNRSE